MDSGIPEGPCMFRNIESRNELGYSSFSGTGGVLGVTLIKVLDPSVRGMK